MRGKRAKIIRKAAYMTWVELVKRTPKLSERRLYRKMKKMYVAGEIY